jgi:predicted P-loop ATPase
MATCSSIRHEPRDSEGVLMLVEYQNTAIRYSIGRDKFDNIPTQFNAPDFNAFETEILSRRSSEKGKTFFCAGFRKGSHKDKDQFPLENTYRQKELVELKRFHALDFDGFRDVEAFNECFKLFKAYRGFGYTTWSHQPNEPRARAVFELSREVTRSEGVQLGQAFQSWIEESLGSGAALFDESVYRGEQPIYSPPQNAQVFRFRGTQKIDVDAFLSSFTPHEISNAVELSNEKSETQGQAYAKLTRKSLTQVLSKLDNTDEPIWTDVANALARVYGEEGREVFIDFSSGVYSGVEYAKFDMGVVVDRYDRALKELGLFKNGIGIKRLCQLAGLDTGTLEFESPPLTEEEKAKQAAFFASLPGHQAFLQSKGTSIISAPTAPTGPLVFPVVNSKSKPTQVSENLKALLTHQSITVRYNQIKKTTEIIIPGMSCVVDERDNTSLTILIDEAVKAGLSPTRIDEMASAIASQNPFCPVQTYIESKSWDGRSRIEAFCDQINTPHPAMARFLIRKWLLQSVAAVYETKGINGAGVLVFTGSQGVGKTRILRDLTSGIQDVFLEGATLNPDDKDSVLTCCSHWMVELGELDATFKKSDVAQLKAFLTRSSDTLRKPYARKDSMFPRRTVFAGTVNDFQFLHDPTGNRRFWPVEILGIKRDPTIDYQQLWAEFKVIYNSGKESWHLSALEIDQLNTYSEQFNVTEPVVEKLLKKYDFASCQKWDCRLMSDICVDINLEKPTRGDMQRLAAAIKKYNGNQTPKESNGKKYHWVPA